MSGSGDDEPSIVPEHATKHLKDTSFDFEDAFSANDDHDPDFTLISATIREELARSHSFREPENGIDAEVEDISTAPARNGRFEHRPRDTSVSTIDIGGPALLYPPSPAQSSLYPTPEESEYSNEFSRVSISENSPPDHEDAPEEEQDREVGMNGHGVSDLQYPTVHIDASKTLSSSGNLVLPYVPELQVDSPSQDPPDSSLRSPPQPKSPFSPDASSPTQFIHKPVRSMGPSALEKVVSKTRPAYLPPKNKIEDNKHMADWETMMKQSRAAELKRRNELQARRLMRERQIEESLHIWERDIVPDWRVVHKSPALRKLWWAGIPARLRASMWERAVGNPLALSKDNYRTCSARAKRAISSGAFPAATLLIIEDDILSTLPALHIFHPSTGPLYQDLKDMLCAWVVCRSDEGLGYTFGIAKIAAMFLINMPVHTGFTVMRNLLERHCMRSFYGGDIAKEDVEAYYRIFDTLLADGMPKIYFNFKQHQISPAAYLPQWLLPLFLDHLPFEACARIWDVLLLEGDRFLYRAALGILGVLESRLFFPDRQELLELLHGENKAALEVAKRTARPLDGGKYEIFGVDEETLWERLDSMNDWWKESTWTRLIHRELPDL